MIYIHIFNMREETANNDDNNKDPRQEEIDPQKIYVLDPDTGQLYNLSADDMTEEYHYKIKNWMELGRLKRVTYKTTLMGNVTSEVDFWVPKEQAEHFSVHIAEKLRKRGIYAWSEIHHGKQKQTEEKQ
jgi:hypothetical protein